jgi:bifunctional non-homologous end joining protein LigD
MAPMLASTSPLPETEARWAWEPKWDGWRVLLWGECGQLRAVTRAGHDVTGLFPELEPLGAIMGRRNAILDGELVAWGEDGRPDFGRLFSRFRGRSSSARQTKSEAPVTWVAFDVCYLDGVSFLDQPYLARRAALEDLDLSGPSGRTTPASLGDGLAMLRAAKEFDLEGVVAKRLDGRYLPGRRSRSWVKVKRFQRAEVVVMGWVPWRNGLSGPLAVGRWGPVGGGQPQLRFAGLVEAGFSEADRAELGRRLAGLQDPNAVPWREHRGQPVYPVRPQVMVEVQLLEWTLLGQGRHLSYKGLVQKPR